MVFLAIGLGNVIGHGAECEVAQIDRVSTHVGNLTGLIEVLGSVHGSLHRKTEACGRFLLQCAGSERRSWSPGAGCLGDVADGEAGIFDLLEKGLRLSLGSKAL